MFLKLKKHKNILKRFYTYKYKKLQFIHCVNGDKSKTAKIIKGGNYPPSHRLNVNVMPSNIAFYDFWGFWSVAVNIMDKLQFFYIYICRFATKFGRDLSQFEFSDIETDIIIQMVLTTSWPLLIRNGTACGPVAVLQLSLIHIWRCRRIERCRSRWSPYH